MRSLRDESSLDRALRIVVGYGVLTLPVIGPVPGWGLLGLTGLNPLITGITGYCPTYRLFDIDTRRSRLRGQELRQ